MHICLIWTLVGVLLSSIPFAAILTLYLKDSAKPLTTVSKTIIPTLRWNQTGITVAGVTSQSTNASNHLKNPWGLYIDWSNTLYIADRFNNRIQKYLKGASFGETVAGQASGINGTGSSFLHAPMDVQVDLNGNIYVADGYNHRIHLWKQSAASGMTIAGTDVVGNVTSELSFPYGLFRDSVNNGIYVADHGNYRVMYYPSGVRNGIVVTGNNLANTNDTQLCRPIGLYLDIESNSLLIANWDRNNVVRWMLGTSKWILVAGFVNRTSSNTANGVSLPADVTLDPMGNIYVADFGNQRIQFFSVSETNGKTIIGIIDLNGNNTSLLNGPVSIVLDSQLNLYVSDYYNHRVQKFMRY